jgi:hypothetical protein
MKTLVRLLLAVVVLGTAVQQGWLQAGTRFLAEQLGGAAAAEQPGPLTGMAMLSRLAGMVGSLPDPWYSLALMVGGIIVLVFAVSLIGGVIRATLRLSGWLRDAFV